MNVEKSNIKDLIRNCAVHYTDLYSLSSRTCPQDEQVTQALAKSCKFPFAFSGFGQANDEVDGGLALNLPVDKLKDQESTHGPVVAIAFSPDRMRDSNSGLLPYLQQLFSASIQSGVNRSRELLGQHNVYPITTDIGTFDFDKALNDGLNKDYSRECEKFRLWMQSWLGRQGGDAPNLTPPVVRPVLASTPFPPAVVMELNSWSRTEQCTKAQSLRVFEVAKLGDDNGFLDKYHTRTLMSFNVTKTYVLFHLILK